MAKYLHFREQPAPSPREVARRLRATFKYVRASRKLAREMIDDSIQYLRQLKRKGTLAGAEVNQRIERLRRHRRGALWVHIADRAADSLAFLQTLIVRGESLFFGYCSMEHERAAAPLLKRCAK